MTRQKKPKFLTCHTMTKAQKFMNITITHRSCNIKTPGGGEVRIGTLLKSVIPKPRTLATPTAFGGTLRPTLQNTQKQDHPRKTRTNGFPTLASPLDTMQSISCSSHMLTPGENLQITTCQEVWSPETQQQSCIHKNHSQASCRGGLF